MHAGFAAVFPTHRIRSQAGMRPQGWAVVFPQPGPNASSDAINQLCSALSPGDFYMVTLQAGGVWILLSGVMYKTVTDQRKCIFLLRNVVFWRLGYVLPLAWCFPAAVERKGRSPPSSAPWMECASWQRRWMARRCCPVNIYSIFSCDLQTIDELTLRGSLYNVPSARGKSRGLGVQTSAWQLLGLPHPLLDMGQTSLPLQVLSFLGCLFSYLGSLLTNVPYNCQSKSKWCSW